MTVAAANVSGASVTLADPATVTLTSAPSLQVVAGFNNGASVQYKAISSNNVEQATSYTLQWSTTSTFTAIAGFKTFPASGAGGANLWFVNSDMTSTSGCTNCSTLTNSSVYYFRVFGTAGSSTSANSSVFGPVTIGAPAPTGGVAVSGTVNRPGTATGPLYVGFYNYNTGAMYGEYIASPAIVQAYTVQVPVASTYYFVGVIDNNNNGIVDAGDPNDVNNSGNPPTANITGATTNENLVLSPVNSLIATYTGHNIQTGQSDTYSVNANVRTNLKLPVAVELIHCSNPDMIVPQDIAICTNCGNHQFSLQDSTSTTIPVLGDNYSLKITYSDGSTDNPLTEDVTPVLTSAAAATALSPQTGTSSSTTPTFTWIYPASASSYTYSFWIYDNNGHQIWQIPANNSKSNGITNSVVSIPWITSGNDVLGDSNLPTVTNLSTSINYNWTFETIDSNNNYLQTTVNYQP